MTATSRAADLLPTGTVTFLFTDIEGSTRLWEAHRAAMQRALARHDELLRQCIEGHGGHVVKSSGDGVCAVFVSAADALEAAIAAQQALADEHWPEPVLIRVRMALHSGPAELRDGDYFGPALNRVARLLGLGRGGQILVSAVTSDLCRHYLPANVSLTSIGERTLKDLDRPETVFEVAHERSPQGLGQGKTRLTPEGPTTPSIAVLPFVNMSRDEENEYFADGLSEELLNVLTNIRGLRVPSRTSAFYFKGKDVDLATIAEKLNVANILEGSVRKSRDRVRVTAQLVQVATDSHLWSKTYDRQLDDIFAVQDDIAHSVVSELRAALFGERIDADAEAKAEVRAAAKARGENAEAYRLYLHARFFAKRSTEENLGKAIEYYHKALAVDPAYALAWAGLAQAHGRKTGAYAQHDIDEGYRQAREAAQRALEVQPDLAEAHDALGQVQFWHEHDWQAAERSFRRALELAPSNVDVMRSAAILGHCLGRPEEAIGLLQRALMFDPLDAMAYRTLADIYLRAGDLTAAELAAQKAAELNPNADFTHMRMGEVRLMQGRLDEALEEFGQEGGTIFRLLALATVHHARGCATESNAALQKLIEIGSGGAAFQIAEAYAYRGNADAAFEWLERAYVQRDSGLVYAKISLRLTNLHGDPRWQPFLEKLRLAD